jgi:hypothetical protein
MERQWNDVNKNIMKSYIIIERYYATIQRSMVYREGFLLAIANQAKMEWIYSLDKIQSIDEAKEKAIEYIENLITPDQSK